MEALANMVIATADLVEAEGRALRRQLVQLGVAASMMLVGTLIAITGLGFLLYGIYWLLEQQMPGPGAAVIFGVGAMVFAGGLLWTARRLIQ